MDGPGALAHAWCRAVELRRKLPQDGVIDITARLAERRETEEHDRLQPVIDRFDSSLLQYDLFPVLARNVRTYSIKNFSQGA